LRLSSGGIFSNSIPEISFDGLATLPTPVDTIVQATAQEEYNIGTNSTIGSGVDVGLIIKGRIIL
jgi:hypothetical protein